tara:strand:- start:2264 stop:3151 length:888 start_codon:yes stop_codon:yes gene_type:complete
MTETPLTPTEEKILQTAQQIMADRTIPLGFVCRSMVSASMPHSKVKGNVYKRKSNHFSLSIVGNEELGGVPYGTYPRLILLWIASEAVRTKNREIVLGASLSDFMKKIGLHVTGGHWGTLSRFKQQLKLLFSSVISFGYEDKKKGEWVHTNMSIAEKAMIFWDPEHPSKVDLFKSKVLLGEAFFKELCDAPVPVDLRAINVLKGSSLALDIYFWLTYRLSYLKSPVKISYESLQIQFGGNYRDTPQGRYEFKRKFSHQLKKIVSLYPEVRLQDTEAGFLLHPGQKDLLSDLEDTN